MAEPGLLNVEGFALEGEWVSSLGPALVCKDMACVFPSGASYRITLDGARCTMDGWTFAPAKSCATKLCWEKEGVAEPIFWNYKGKAGDAVPPKNTSAAAAVAAAPTGGGASPAAEPEPAPSLVVHNLVLDGRWQSTLGAALVCANRSATFAIVGADDLVFPIEVATEGRQGEVCRMDGWTLNWRRSSATTLRWEKRGSQDAVFWDYLGKIDEVASAGRGRRTHTEHLSDTFPLVGQRILIGRGVDGGATGVILEYLTEKIVRLTRDDTGRKETLSLEARPFSLVRGGPDLVELLEGVPNEEHDAIAQRFFREAPRANLDIRDMCFAERLDRLLRDGYAPCAVNLGEKLLHAEKPEVNTDVLSLRIISAKKGRGYAASKPIAAGTILLREVGLRVPLHNAEALAAAILLACATEPDCVWDKPGLCGACEDMPSIKDSFVPCFIGPDEKAPPSLKAWNTAREQVASNFFTSDNPPPSNILQGYGSFFNHSCDPNAAWNHNNMGTFVVRAIKPIKPGEEVCFTYSDEIAKDDSVFKCGCDQCVRRRKRQRTNARKSVAQWVQCDDCGKWRQTPYTIEELKSVPSTWRCIDNPAYTAPENCGDSEAPDGITVPLRCAAATACAEPEEEQEDEQTYVLDEEEEEDLIYSEDDEEEDDDEKAAKRRKRGNLEGLSVEGPGGISLETEIDVPEPKRKKGSRGASPKEGTAPSAKRAPGPTKPVIVAETAAEWEYVRDPPVVLPEGNCRPELDDAAMQLRLWEEICAATESDPDPDPENGGEGGGGRVLSELFLELPERVTLPAMPPFPKPSPVAPEIRCGDVTVLVMGKLPNMAKRLPSQEDLATWDKPSQLAFWDQRRTYWGSGKGSGGTGWSGWKLGDLQREARKRGLFPGGDIGFVRNRLLRNDYCKDQLLASETRSEEDCIREEMQVGVLYYKIVAKPIDLAMIKARIDGEDGGYPELGALEKDLLLLFANAKRFDAEANDAEDDRLTSDASALLSTMKATIRRMRNDAVGLGKANKGALQAAVRAAAVYASQEVRRWEMRPGSLTKRKRVRKRTEAEEGDGGRRGWMVVGGRGEGTNVVLLKRVGWVDGGAPVDANEPAPQEKVVVPKAELPEPGEEDAEEVEEVEAADQCPHCPAGSGKPAGHRGRHAIHSPKADVDEAERAEEAVGDCPLCATGSGRPTGHRGRHSLLVEPLQDAEEEEVKKEVSAPKQKGKIGSLFGAW